MNDIGIGVVGLGRLGYVHARNIAREVPNAKLVAVCDIDEDKANNTSRELGCKPYNNVNKMLEDKDIDAVCVVTPTSLHVDPVTAVAEAGKPLFCEKPLAGTLSDNLKLSKLIKKAGIICQMGFMRRFDPPCAEAEVMIKEGAIGKPVYFCGFSRDPFPAPPWACDPAKGGGLFIDVLIHDFDLARFLMEDEVLKIYADETNLVVNSQGINRFADNVTANLHFKGGALGTCHASMHAKYGYDMRTEIYGSEGNLILGGLNSTELTLCTAERGISKPLTFQTKDKIPHFMFRFKEAYVNEMAAFVESILYNKPPIVNEDDAVKAYRISIAAAKSAGVRKEVSVI
ncbi:MAG: Gfo/Idh/MocA family oxidoreductase [Spirochaetales bacterium]|nr:Gfo/Idh/MocA family oxidoreductase [Spirochaetales bacterium]